MVLCLWLSNCSKISNFDAFVKAPQNLLKNPNKAQITRENISTLPYASIAAKIHSSNPSRIILGQILGNQLFWYSAEKEVLVTEFGRVVRSFGLEHDLLGLRFSDDSAHLHLHQLQKPLKITYFLDLNRKNLQNLMAEAVYSLVKPEKITIYDITYDTLKISEKVYVKEIDWRFENIYWVHVQDGYVWKSIQHLHPKLDPIEISVLKRLTP